MKKLIGLGVLLALLFLGVVLSGCTVGGPPISAVPHGQLSTSLGEPYQESGNWWSDGTYRVDQRDNNSLLFLVRDMLEYYDARSPSIYLHRLIIERPRTDEEAEGFCNSIGLLLWKNEPSKWSFTCVGARKQV